MTTNKIDLVALIEQAAPQAYGSDERDMLQAWLDRVCRPYSYDTYEAETGQRPQMIVEIDLSKVLINENGPGG